MRLEVRNGNHLNGPLLGYKWDNIGYLCVTLGYYKTIKSGKF